MESVIINEVFGGDLWQLALVAHSFEENSILTVLAVAVLAAVMIRSRINYCYSLDNGSGFIPALGWAALMVSSFILLLVPMMVIRASNASIDQLKETHYVFSSHENTGFAASINDDGTVMIKAQTKKGNGSFKEISFFRATAKSYILINEEMRIYSFTSPLSGRAGLVRTLIGDEFRIFLNTVFVIERFSSGGNGFI